MSNKALLRKNLKIVRKTLPSSRKKEASQAVLKKFKTLKGNILSFASFNDEIDLWELNHHLALNGQLILPQVEQEGLALYRIHQLYDQVALSKWNILEPIAKKTEKILPTAIAYALIPGLGFDPTYHRLGYGKGYYDQLLPMLRNALKIGIGYKEQLLDSPIPITDHDAALDELSLF